MTPAAILAHLETAGLHLRVEGGNLIVHPRAALTDELRGLLRQHKAELLAKLQPQTANPASAPQASPARCEPDDEPPASPMSGLDCCGCNNLEMREEPQPGIRRRFFWRCTARHGLLEGRNFGERIILAPPECREFEQWKPGTR